jgi:polyferredoxin
MGDCWIKCSGSLNGISLKRNTIIYNVTCEQCEQARYNESANFCAGKNMIYCNCRDSFVVK